mgnify:CR=1 FL=1
MPLTAAEKQARRRAKLGSDYAKYLRDWRAANKDKVKKHNQTQKLNGNHSKYWKGKNGKATSKRGYEKKMADPGRRLMLSIGSRITQSMADPSNRTSTRLTEFTEFTDSTDVRVHFESKFKPWMNWTNYGVHKLGGPRNWNVGHRIPLSKYDANNKEDFRRCWTRANLFPQEAKQNHELNDSLPNIQRLMMMSEVWPLAWCGRLPSSVG